MRVLGIDPGSHRCGWAALDIASQTQLLSHGCFDYPAKSDVGGRLVKLESDVRKLCQKYIPDLIAIESLFFNKNITTAMRVSEARGVILLAAAKQAIPTTDCSPLQVKMAITGYGRADKSQIKTMIEHQFKNQKLDVLDDAVDAIGVAITGATLYRSAKKTGTL